MENTEAATPWTPTCVALTDSADGSPPYEGAREVEGGPNPRTNHASNIGSNYFKGAEWSADGTTVLTNSADNHIRTYILPPELLEERETPHILQPYSVLPSKEPVYATAGYPYFSLNEPSTTVFLSSVRDHPIRLNSALAPGYVASYSLVSPTTEMFITPHSLLYPASLGGTRFLTGSDSLICLFDVSRPGKDGPVSRFATIPSKRKKIVGGGVGMKGIISTLAIDPSGSQVLAAGTFTRHVGLYASNGSGDCIATFSVSGTEADHHTGGKGITQVLWSPCGRYLYVVERKSHGILVYDVRVAGRLVGWLQGRKAMTNQRLNADVAVLGEDGSHEIWAGGTDGSMKVWKNPYKAEGGKDPDSEWNVHEDPVTSTVIHPTGSVAATCAGQKFFPNSTDGLESNDKVAVPDNSLKIWAL